MLKNRHKALTLWAKAKDYQTQQALRQAAKVKLVEMRKLKSL